MKPIPTPWMSRGRGPRDDLRRAAALLVTLSASAAGAGAQEPQGAAASRRSEGLVQGIHYVTVGSGPALVLIHGGGMDLGMWDAQADAFADDFQVIRLDLRGFGSSPAPDGPFAPASDLVTLLDHLGVRRAHVVGPSLGGAIAIDFALAHPDRVSSLILPEPGIAGWQYSEEVMRSMTPVISALGRGDRDGALFALLDTPAFAYARAHHEAAFATISMLVRDNLGGLMTQGLMRFEEPAALDELERLSVPILILVSEAAGADAVRIADRIEDAVPGARRVGIERSGHLMNLERPEAFNRAVLGFLRNVETSGAGRDGAPGEPR